MPLFSIAGFASLGPANQYQPQRYRDPERNYDVSINWQHGTHNIRGGFEADLQDSNEVQYEIAGNSVATNAGGFTFAQGTTQLSGGPVRQRLQRLCRIPPGPAAEPRARCTSFPRSTSPTT